MLAQTQTGTCTYGQYANCSICSGCAAQEKIQ